MLKLEYARSSDKFQTVTVLGSPRGVADLYWQLKYNHSGSPDGTGVGSVTVTNLDGVDVTDNVMQAHYEHDSRLDKNLAT